MKVMNLGSQIVVMILDQSERFNFSPRFDTVVQLQRDVHKCTDVIRIRLQLF